MGKTKRATTDCPCGSGRNYVRCCGPLHDGQPAPTALALMRSRYSAYVLDLADYLLATWHPRTRPVSLPSDDGTTRWLGLSVKRHEQTSADEAVVEFVARYRAGGAGAVRIHEVSRFVREDGRWLYLDGELR